VLNLLISKLLVWSDNLPKHTQTNCDKLREEGFVFIARSPEQNE